MPLAFLFPLTMYDGLIHPCMEYACNVCVCGGGPPFIQLFWTEYNQRLFVSLAPPLLSDHLQPLKHSCNVTCLLSVYPCNLVIAQGITLLLNGIPSGHNQLQPVTAGHSKDTHQTKTLDFTGVFSYPTLMAHLHSSTCRRQIHY